MASEFVQKKTGKLRVIMDLSRPTGSSVNDFMNIKDFPFSFCRVDDAIRLLTEAGRGAYMAISYISMHSG